MNAVSQYFLIVVSFQAASASCYFLAWALDKRKQTNKQKVPHFEH